MPANVCLLAVGVRAQDVRLLPDPDRPAEEAAAAELGGGDVQGAVGPAVLR